MSANILLISESILKERSVIHDNTDAKLIYPDIKFVQDEYIERLLGTGLFNKLQDLISNNTIGNPGNEDYKLLLDKYIIDTIVYYVMAQLPMTLSYQFWNKGVIRKQGQDTDLPSMTELTELAAGYKNRAERYANRCKLFLLDQSGRFGKFPEYINPGSQVDTVYPSHKPFTMPIYLGDEWDNPYCNPGGFNGQPYKP